MKRDVYMAKKITQEELEQILQLPPRTFRIANEITKGLFDEENRKFYELDANGKLTGVVVTIPAPPSPTQGSSEAASADEKPVPEEESANEDEASTSEPDNKKGFFAKHKLPIIIGGSALAVLILGVGIVGGVNGGTVHTPSENPGALQSDDVSTKEISVIRVTKDLLQGHILTPDDVEESVISKAEYDNLVLYGRNLYSYNQIDKLIGNYVNSFVPLGQYLESTNVQAASPISINPWTYTEAGSTLVTVPVDDELAENLSFGFGSVVNMTVSKTTASQVGVGNASNEKNEIPGVSHVTSTIGTTKTDEITINNLVVCDLLDAKGNSLYADFSSYISVPLGDRLYYFSERMKAEPKLYESSIPVSVVLRIADQQVDALGDIETGNVTIVLKNTNKFWTNTNEQSAFATEFTAVKNVLAQAYAVATTPVEENTPET